MLKRVLFYDILGQIDHKNALVVTGMRQVGKTTLMKQIFEEIGQDKSKLWFDFENPLDMKVFEDIDYNVIYTRLAQMAGNTKNRLYIFIDEIQNFPEITKIIKYLIDHYGVKFLVTGSSNFYLKNLFPESLSGRKFLHDLSPLSFKEFLYFHDQISLDDAKRNDLVSMLHSHALIEIKKFEPYYDNYLRYGGFPEVAMEVDNELKKEILKNIFKSFFEKDLKILSDHKDIRELRDLLLLLVPRVGSMLDISKVASELGVERAKIYSYLEFLQGTFMIRLLPKFSKSIDRAVAGGKKVYFSDNGLLGAIGSVNDAQLLENAVVNQLANYGDLSFYNKRNTAEIDVIYNKKIAIEIKASGSESDRRKLTELSGSLGIKQNYIISKNFVEKDGFVSPAQL
ncbi:MAG: hypothetical protein A3J93_03600 [Candidatus Magasanikbacteria bacterium RIFOXYC2_FULL_42_28]|uniref:ATPase n=1 Tax=Candidatus Magasanikbacteria bacterium RIFOXYC2_FULL_42_28 TaxID=1798704 RepID=A0A1F6NUH0_9BACT|nr:MAG: hypothetical protein A3J93_03600 [Candidatus Magasanikbacteria bacterium RIFOXYC2_FULL_42_28]